MSAKYGRAAAGKPCSCISRQPRQLVILPAGLHMHPRRLRAVEVSHFRSPLLPRQLRPWAFHPRHAWLRRLLLARLR